MCKIGIVFCCCATFVFSSCSTVMLRNEDSGFLKSSADRIEERIDNMTDDQMQEDVRLHRIYKTGWYFVMRQDGTIKAHPNREVAGMNAFDCDERLKQHALSVGGGDRVYFDTTPVGIKVIVYLRQIKSSGDIIRIENPILIIKSAVVLI